MKNLKKIAPSPFPTAVELPDHCKLRKWSDIIFLGQNSHKSQISTFLPENGGPPILLH